MELLDIDANARVLCSVYSILPLFGQEVIVKQRECFGLYIIEFWQVSHAKQGVH